MSNRNNSSTSLRFYGGVPATEENYQEKAEGVLSALRGPQKPPRPWADMWPAHRALGGSLLTLLMGEEAAAQLLAAMLDKSNEAKAWWGIMWSLPPRSEARKAAFTLGHAALLIERWRKADASLDGGPMPGGVVKEAQAIGQRAESMLRIAAWHLDDARGEAHARTLGVEPTIPQHERIYRPVSEEPVGKRVCPIPSGADPLWKARRILGDHVEIDDQLVQAFAETAIASLPDGPWVMTSRDVERFLDMILDEHLFCTCDVPGGVGPICAKCGKRCRGSRGRA